MSTKMNALIENVLEGSITDAVRDVVGKMWPEKRSQLSEFTDALLVKLGLRIAGMVLLTGKTQVIELGSGSDSEEKAADDAASTDSASGNAAPAEPKAAAAATERKRTVSKKMKDEFEAAGGDEKQLKAAMKAYKAASDEQVAVGWAAFSGPFRGAAAVAAVAAAAPVTPPKKAAAATAEPAAPDAPAKEKKPRAKSEKNFTWTPSAKKLFAETVEASGGTVSDLLKDRFAAHVNALTPDAYKVLAAVGHMRQFLTAAPAAAVAVEPVAAVAVEPVAVEPVAAVAVEPVAVAAAAAPAADDDEDMESFEFEGEELFIGVSSGKIYRQTESSGDVLIGVAGEGRFKDVKKPVAE
jgi:hypothetical protein